MLNIQSSQEEFRDLIAIPKVKLFGLSGMDLTPALVFITNHSHFAGLAQRQSTQILRIHPYHVELQPRFPPKAASQFKPTSRRHPKAAFRGCAVLMSIQGSWHSTIRLEPHRHLAQMIRLETIQTG